MQLESMNLFHSRGPRAGRSSVRSIPVHSADNRRKQKVKEARVTTFIEVLRVLHSLPSLLLLNLTSLANKVDELTVTMRAASADIVAITEARQIVPEVCSIDKYQLFHHLKKGRRGGGVALFCTMLSVPHYSVWMCLMA